jgi:hypothetical protein
MILAKIRNKEKNLTVTVPCQWGTLTEDIASIGVWNPKGDVSGGMMLEKIFCTRCQFGRYMGTSMNSSKYPVNVFPLDSLIVVISLNKSIEIMLNNGYDGIYI